MSVLFQSAPLRPARFEERLNRFMVRFRDGGRTGTAYVANPGRMGEILLPGTELLLEDHPERRIVQEVVGARWEARWPGDGPRVVFLNTGAINGLVRRALEQRMVPALAAWDVERSEVPVGSSRFDFLLRRGRSARCLLEVKSVTLVEQGLALFPDACTERGRRHLEELAHLAQGGETRTAVLFLVQGEAQRFLPDVHNDLAFSRTLVAAREHVQVLPYALQPQLTPEGCLRVEGPLHPLRMPWSRLEASLQDRGLYLVVLDVAKDVTVEVGSLGPVAFPAGSYVYVGSAQRALTARVDRHARRRKTRHWHLDFLREHASRVVTLPVRGATEECALAADVAALGHAVVPRFGSSDCSCPGHLVRFPSTPLHTAPFQQVLTRWRHQSLDGKRRQARGAA